MNLYNYDGLIKARTCDVVAALQALTPHDRAAVLSEAQKDLDELDSLTPAQVAEREEVLDRRAVITNWVGHVFDKLGPEEKMQFLEFTQTLDEQARLRTMIQE